MAKTVGKGFVDLDLVTPYVILAGLVGAIVWDLITWWLGLPTSSSHALIGGYAGAAIARVSAGARLEPQLRRAELGPSGEWPLTLMFIVVAPLIGMVSAYALMIAGVLAVPELQPLEDGQVLPQAAACFRRRRSACRTAPTTRRRPWASSPACCSRRGYQTTLRSSLLGAAGGLLGHRAGHPERRLAHRPHHGRPADAPEAAQRLLRGDGRGRARCCSPPTWALPVSTTHAIAGAIAGVGSIQRMKAVRWGIATNIVWAWVLTIPAAAIIALISYYLLHFVAGVLRRVDKSHDLASYL